MSGSSSATRRSSPRRLLVAALAIGIPTASVAYAALPSEAAVSGGTITVAADGSGQYRSVQAAINAISDNNSSRVTVSIKPGTYREIVTVPATKPNVSLKGAGSSPDQVVIVNNHSAATYGTF